MVNNDGTSKGSSGASMPSSNMAIKLKGLTGAQQFENWKQFKFQFNNYMIATRQDSLEEERKVAVLLHLLGIEVIAIYQSFNTTTAKKLDEVIKLFDGYFSPKRNLSLERNVFLSRHQQPGESLEVFFTTLKNLAESCDFGQLKDSLVKDMFILGLVEENSYLRERLLEEGDAKTLSEIFDLARTIEMSKDKAKGVFGVRYQQKQHSSNRPPQRNNKPKQQQLKCQSCGFQHQPNKCPAARAACNSCSKVGHYAKMCRNKKLYMVQETPENNFFIGAVNSGTGSQQWTSVVEVNNKLLTMNLDTGAEANVMSLSSYKETGLPMSGIRPTGSKLTAYGGSNIPVEGHCIMTCKVNQIKLPIRFFICKMDQPTVLGSLACEKFKLITRIGSIFEEQFGSYSNLMASHRDLFEGLGCLPGYVRIDLKETAVPQVDPPRRVPFKRLEAYKAELDRMVRMNVIQKLEKPTEWLNSVVLVEKPDSTIRVCLDPGPLNKSILRSQYQLPTIEDFRSKLAGAKYFSKLDASTAFWSMQLDEPSSDLCAFGTPWGRFKFLRLAYGLSLAPEKFHQKMVECLGDIEGVQCYIDDILIFAKNKDQHDNVLKKVLERVRSINLKLNIKKCEIGKQKITFLGQIFQPEGMSPDYSKVEAIEKMPVPQNVKDLQRFLGMVNYLSSYLPNLSNKCVNLRKLLKKETLWCWETVHQTEFDNLKKLICQAPILSFFDVRKPMVLTVDSSQFAVGACLLQEQKPVAFASKSLTETQVRWAQIEKELFSIWFGCLKFHQYVYGQNILVETDHKPLVTLFKKPLSDIPNRLQRIMLKLQLYDLHVVYKAGKEMYVSDTLSRAALPQLCTEFDEILDEELAVHSNMFIKSLSATDARLSEIAESTKVDKVLMQVKNFILMGWPEYKKLVPQIVQPFYPYRNELHICNEIIFKGSCIVIPKTMQSDMLKSMHSSHMGYQKNKNFVKHVVFWPTLYADLKFSILTCNTCNKFKPNNVKEPLIPHEVPSHPWEKVGVDLFEFNRCHYLILVDYYSKFFETVLLHSTNSAAIISQFKSIFSRQGIPAQLISDRGPPFSSAELNKFYKEWNINHHCSSPYYPKSNGMVEQTVKLVKYTLMKCKDSDNDPYLALLHLRNSSGDGQEPPSRLLNARLLRTNLPMVHNQLKTKPVTFKKFRSDKRRQITNMKKYYNKGAKTLEPLKLNDSVFYQKKPGDTWLPATVSKLPHQINSKRAYEIITSEGKTYCRNRIYLRKCFKPLIETHSCTESDSIKTHETDQSNISSLDDGYLYYYSPDSNIIENVGSSSSANVEDIQSSDISTDRAPPVQKSLPGSSQSALHSEEIEIVDISDVSGVSQHSEEALGPEDLLNTTFFLDLDESSHDLTYTDDPKDLDWKPNQR